MSTHTANAPYTLSRACRPYSIVVLLTITVLGSCAPVSHRAKWQQYLHAGQYDKAIPLLKTEIQKNPQNGIAQNDIGFAYQMSGQHDLAEAHGEQAVRLLPGSADAHANLAIARVVKGRFQEAVDLLSRAIRLEPGSRYAHGLLAQAYLALGKRREAVEGIKGYVALNPTKKSGHFIWAVACDSLGEYDKAAAHYLESDGCVSPIYSSEKAPWPPGVFWLGQIRCSLAAAHRLFLAGDLTRAEELAKKLYPKAWFGVEFAEHDAGALIRQVVPGSSAELAGLRSSDIILAIDGKDVDRWTALGAMYAAQPGSPTAITVRRAGKEKVLRVTPASRPNAAIAWCQLARGQYADALATFERCRSIAYGVCYPWEPAQRGISIALFKKGNRKESEQAWGWAYLGAEVFIEPQSGRARVVWVWPDSPAERAGFKAGDVIRSYAAQDVRLKSEEDLAGFRGRISRTPVGLDVPVEVMRDGKLIELYVRPEMHPMLRP